jgi:hypothetical protein
MTKSHPNSRDSKAKAPSIEKVDRPADHYRTPQDICDDQKLSPAEKKAALNTWEQDAHQLLTASGEGMAGSKEGLKPTDHHRLGEVVRAKKEIGAEPKQKAAH